MSDITNLETQDGTIMYLSFDTLSLPTRTYKFKFTIDDISIAAYKNIYKLFHVFTINNTVVSLPTIIKKGFIKIENMVEVNSSYTISFIDLSQFCRFILEPETLKRNRLFELANVNYFD